ncbi:MAG: pyrimidine 5'-nucleotidase [Deltaproteobacteria bacterium HGW-Deltaproteobacteria-4]|nr:MAG: pyrimidine 5'-nucleotidase [Deltaproteobacteria bacterium HGW-Deltaproteobacteria-4]
MTLVPAAPQIILFDLDNTLYAPEYDLFSLIDCRINRFMEEVVGIAADDVDPLRRYYWQEYGVTLQGLIRHFDVDPEAYLHYVHDVDVTSRLVADPGLATILAALPQRKVVFTNGSSAHAERVLAALGIRQEFEAIFDIRIANYLPKPFFAPYEEIVTQLGTSPQSCVMIEDVAKNLAPAKTLGMATILVGGSDELPPYVDLRIDTIHEISAALQLLQE